MRIEQRKKHNELYHGVALPFIELVLTGLEHGERTARGVYCCVTLENRALSLLYTTRIEKTTEENLLWF